MNVNRAASSSAIAQIDRSRLSMRGRIVANFYDGASPADYCYSDTGSGKCLLMMSYSTICIPTDGIVDLEISYPTYWKILDD
jgi:hypothetical protein